jgi:hypothetical protein
MTFATLTEELRRRLRAKGLVPHDVLGMTPDREVIASYVRCPDCGHVPIGEPLLAQLVATARNAAHFLKLLRDHEGTHGCRN